MLLPCCLPVAQVRSWQWFFLVFNRNPWMHMACSISATLTSLLTVVPGIQSVFSTAALPWWMYLFAIGCGFVNLILDELIPKPLYRLMKARQRVSARADRLATSRRKKKRQTLARHIESYSFEVLRTTAVLVHGLVFAFCAWPAETGGDDGQSVQRLKAFLRRLYPRKNTRGAENSRGACLGGHVKQRAACHCVHTPQEQRGVFCLRVEYSGGSSPAMAVVAPCASPARFCADGRTCRHHISRRSSLGTNGGLWLHGKGQRYLERSPKHVRPRTWLGAVQEAACTGALA